MSDTPVLGLPEIAEGVASQTVLHNQALRLIEARIVRVLSRTTTAPPGSPAEGDSYIVPAGATGAWSGLADQVASFVGGGWVYYTPGEGVRLWVNDADETIVFDGAAWVLSEGSASVGTVTSVTVAIAADDTVTESGSPIVAAGTSTLTAVDAGADMLVGWDDSASKKVYFTLGTNLSTTGTTLNAAGGGGGTPGGSDMQVQFNDSSAFGGDDALTWNKTTHLLTVGTTTTPGTVIGPAAATTTSAGVALTVKGSPGGSTSGTGGALNLTGGTPTDGVGGAVAIAGGAGVGTNRVGGAVTVTGGAGSGLALGSAVTITGGAAGPTGILGGPLNLVAGAATTSSSTGGNVNVTGGQGNAAGGDISITSGAGVVAGSGSGAIVIASATAVGTNSMAGTISITGGSASGFQSGPDVSIRAGTGGASSGAGGVASVTGGTGGAGTSNIAGIARLVGGTAGAAASGTGGAAQVTGGAGATTSTGGVGGAVTITGGSSGGSAANVGGVVTVTGGRGSATGAGAAVTITGGAGGSTSGAAAGVTVRGGTPVDGNGGTVTIIGSAGVGTNRSGGNVLVQPGVNTGSGTPGNIQLDGGRGAALGTTATGGFVTIPTCAGTPTGVPVNVPTGSVPMVFDTTGVRLWTHTGGAWQSGPPPGSVNAIINGDMMIWQRGTSWDPMPTGAYGPDRWRYYTGTARHSWWRVTNAPTVAQAGRLFSHSLFLDCITAAPSIPAGEVTMVTQIIEGYNWVPCAQRACTLSFWVSAFKAGVYCISLCNSNGDRSFIAEYTINTSDTWEFKVIAIPPSPSAGTWNYTNGQGAALRFALGVGSSSIGTAGWQTGNFLATANQVNAVDTVANFFFLTGVDLRPGTFTAPQFVSRSFGEELALCQRYYEKTFRYDTAPAAGTGFNNGDGLRGKAFSAGTAEPFYTWRFATVKRAAPTITLYNLRAGGAAGQWSNHMSTLDGVSAQATNTSEGGTTFDTQGNQVDANSQWAIAATAEAEL